MVHGNKGEAGAINAGPVVPVAHVPLLIIIALTLANGFFNSMAVALGYDMPYTTFVFDAHDRFADLLKAALSLPGSRIPGFDGWSPIYRDYLLNNPYYGAEGLSQNTLTNLHGMPFPTSIMLLARLLLSKIGLVPVSVFFLSFWLLPFLAFAWRYAQGGMTSLLSVAAFLLSYPLIFALTRGNISAGIVGVCLVAAIVATYERKYAWLAALCVAIAINIRPNAVLFVLLPFVSWRFREAVIYCCGSVGLAAAIFGVSLVVAHAGYGDYSLGNFYKAVLIYHKLYAVGDSGLGYGTSLLGAIKLTYKLFHSEAPTGVFEPLIAGLSLISLISWCLCVVRGWLPRRTALFILLCIYCLSSSIFGDYHLIVFYSTILIYVVDLRGADPALDSADKVILLCACLILAPKNYFFYDGFSLQILLNPPILVWGLVQSAISGLRKGKGHETSSDVGPAVEQT